MLWCQRIVDLLIIINQTIKAKVPCLNTKRTVMECKGTVQLKGNVAHTHSRVPQRNPLRGLNVEMPCAKPVCNCVDNHLPCEYYYSSARISQGLTCTQASQAQQPAAHCSYLCTIFIKLPRLVAPVIISSNCLRLLFWSLHEPRHGPQAWTDWVTTGLTVW